MCCGEASVELGMAAFTHPHLHGSGPCHLRRSPWHVREFTESLLKCISSVAKLCASVPIREAHDFVSVPLAHNAEGLQ